MSRTTARLLLRLDRSAETFLDLSVHHPLVPELCGLVDAAGRDFDGVAFVPTSLSARQFMEVADNLTVGADRVLRQPLTNAAGVDV